jgi:hypothetical protein
MKEDELYDVVKEFLESKGYFPVKKEPLIRIRGYRPDITGLKGKEVRCVEVKPDFDERSSIEAITQARVYQFGSTHVYVAFPKDSWFNSQNEELRELTKKLCKENNLGIYLIDKDKKTLEEIQIANFSTLLNLEDYDSTIEQLEGTKWITLENTKPEYIRDVCILLFEKGNPTLTRKELFENLKKEFPNPSYWLFESRSPAKDKSIAIKNRIKCSIKGAIELGFVEIIEPDKEGNEDNDKVRLSYDGILLSKLSGGKTDKNKLIGLNENTKNFLMGYMMKFPVIRMAVEVLWNENRIMLLGQSRCSNGHSEYNFKKLIKSGNQFLCPKCKSPMEICLVHKLILEYGNKEYWWPIMFTKSLNIFNFPKIQRLLGISLKTK